MMPNQLPILLSRQPTAAFCSPQTRLCRRTLSSKEFKYSVTYLDALAWDRMVRTNHSIVLNKSY